MKQKNTIHWLWRITGKKKGYILALTLIQGAAGVIGVIYALLFRAVVDSAVGKDVASFRYHVILIIGLVLVQLGVSAVIRWLHELAKADIENAFKLRLLDNILRKDYASVSATHTAEWLNRLTSDTAVVAGGAVEILPGLFGTVVRLVSALVMIIALGDVKKELEEAGIWYMPLKGAVLKELYPKCSMREFSDHDILFDASRADDVKAIMERLGFTAEYFGTNNHDCYYKNPCLSFEMHRSLFGHRHDEKLYAYYQHVEERLLGDSSEKHFSPEDFYVYFLAHEYSHYSGGGTGLRSLMDTYVYLSKTRLDMNYVEAELEKLGILEFEKQNRSLSFHLYGGETLTASDQDMLDYILSSGTYGTETHRMTHRIQKKIRENRWSKIRYMLDRFSVPISRKNLKYANYTKTYPFFYRHKTLLPLLPFYRIFRAIQSGRFKTEAKAVKDA